MNLHELALPPTKVLYNKIENISEIQYEDDKDTIILGNKQSIVITASYGPFNIKILQPDGKEFYNESFVMVNNEVDTVKSKDINDISLKVSKLLEHPVEIVVPFCTATPVIREKDKEKTFKDTVKAAMKCEPDSILIRTI
jgi:aspartate ammonia-lyase